ncbi:recombinase family protein [Micromonospora violae]|uniref:recombinase family protein n=1 Tax=Micromonospora violae TaxID=1278207 RepID=UPI00102B13B9
MVGVVPTYRIGRLVMVGDPVTGTAAEAGRTVVYARVSSADQKADLDRQVARVSVWVTGQKLGVASLCARLSGRRAAANRARRVVEAAAEARV